MWTEKEAKQAEQDAFDPHGSTLDDDENYGGFNPFRTLQDCKESWVKEWGEDQADNGASAWSHLNDYSEEKE